MKKPLLLICLLTPLLAHSELAPTKQARDFDRKAEDFLYGGNAINPTTNKMREWARAQGTLRDKDGKLVPPPAQVPVENQPVDVPPAPAYRTMGDAARAGVDPLNLVTPMTSRAAIPGSQMRLGAWHYVGAFGLFALIAAVIFFVSSRGTGKRED